MLSLPFGREESVSSDLTFDFLMVLLESKATTSKSAKFLEELFNKTLEYEAENAGSEKTTYEDHKTKHGLWSMEKLLTEFRKLFINKTKFMNLYAEYESKKPQTQNGYPYKPTLNSRSVKLDVISQLLHLF